MSLEGTFVNLSLHDGGSVVAMFWYLILLEGPRYLLANLAAALSLFAPRPTALPVSLSVSVVLPAHNGITGVMKSVVSLREQNIGRVQIVIVDDGSIDGMRRECARLQREGVIDVFVSSGLRGGKSASLNLGLRHCTGDIVVSVDADTTFDRDSIERLLRGFTDPAMGCIGGNVGVRNPRQSLLTAMQAVEYMIGISLGRRVSTLLGLLPVASGAFSAFRREALVSIGGWEAGPGEDADLALKLRRAGWKVGFASDAWALTDAPPSLFGLLNQRLRWESDLVRLHLRKFKFGSPTHRNFSIAEVVATIEALVFSIGLSLGFVVYVCWAAATYGFMAIPILAISGLIYSGIAVATFILAAGVSDRRGSFALLPYAIGYGFYCVYLLHPLRLWACVDELAFGRSYRTNFVPQKVLSRIERF